MKKEELYPKDEEILLSIGRRPIYMERARTIARFAVDNAVEKIVEYLEANSKDYSAGRYIYQKGWQALMKLIK